MSPSFPVCFYPILFIFAVTRTGIKSLTSSNFDQIGPLTTELAALERLKISHRLIMGKWCLHASPFIFYRIFIKLAGNQDRHKSSVEFDFGPNQTTHFGVTCPWVTKISHFCLTWIFLKSVGKFCSNFMRSIIGVGERLHKVLGQIGSRLVTMATESPIYLQWRKWCLQLFSVVSSPEPKAHKVSLQYTNSPSSVRRRPHFQTWIFLKPVDQYSSNV